MALVQTTVNAQIGGLFLEDAAVTATKVTLGTSGTFALHQVRIVNTANSHKVFLKLYVSDPTVGTTNPSCIFPCEASSTSEYSFDGAPSFSNLYYAATQEAGTGGTTAPSNAITVQFIITSS